MGGGEVAFELGDLLNDPRWDKLWLQYCRLFSAPADVIIRDNTTGKEGADGAYLGGSQSAPRLAAYAYLKTKNPVFAPGHRLVEADARRWTRRAAYRRTGLVESRE